MYNIPRNHHLAVVNARPEATRESIAKKLGVPQILDKNKMCNNIHKVLIDNEIAKKNNVKWFYWFNEPLPTL